MKWDPATPSSSESMTATALMASPFQSVLPVTRFSRPIGQFFRLIGRAIFGGLRFFGRFRNLPRYCATTVSSGNQW